MCQQLRVCRSVAGKQGGAKSCQGGAKEGRMRGSDSLEYKIPVADVAEELIDVELEVEFAVDDTADVTDAVVAKTSESKEIAAVGERDALVSRERAS